MDQVRKRRRSHGPELPAVRRGAIICDVDGTLARRDQPIGVATAKALAEAAVAGWEIVILTGQPFSNIEPRLVQRMRLAFRNLTEAPFVLRVLTCEGASEWHITDSDCVQLSAEATGMKHIPAVARDGMTLLMNARLLAMLPDDLRLRQPPVWLEDAMCIMKVDPHPVHRRALADSLSALFRQEGFESLRIGLAGKTSIVIAHELTHKGTALSRIVQNLDPDQKAIYIADEFTEHGNDAVALQVEGLICVDFSRSESDGTGGPTAAVPWLRRLSEASRPSEISTEDVISHIVSNSRVVSKTSLQN